MKKAAVLLLAVIITLTLCACADGSDAEKSTQTTSAAATAAEPDDLTLVRYLDSAAAQGKYNWNSFSESDQKLIREKAENENIDLDILDDGEMVVSDGSTDIVITYGCSWPSDNALIGALKEPKYSAVAYKYVREDTMCLVALFMEYEDCKEYAKGFADCGFDAQETEYDYESEGYYYYAAANSDGLIALIVLEDGITMIGVMPPQNI